MIYKIAKTLSRNKQVKLHSPIVNLVHRIHTLVAPGDSFEPTCFLVGSRREAFVASCDVIILSLEDSQFVCEQSS